VSGRLGAFTAHVFLPIYDKSKVYLLNHANRVDLAITLVADRAMLSTMVTLDGLLFWMSL